jgi:TetR/AcrR family transcriptional regulator, transcriptional repressor for nem operon
VLRSGKTSAGRPRSFDSGRALVAARDVFHAEGLSGTTYQRLEQATGLKTQSLVYAFGDKQALFRAALRSYIDEQVGEIERVLREPGGVAGVRLALDRWVAQADDRGRGCLLVNSTGEIGACDGEARALIAAATERLVAAFERALRQAAASGELKSAARPADLARMAVTMGDGALLHARAAGHGNDARVAFRAFATTLFGPLDL